MRRYSWWRSGTNFDGVPMRRLVFAIAVSLLAPLRASSQAPEVPLPVQFAVPAAAVLPAARRNDNRAAAGSLQDGVLTLRLEARWVAWTLHSSRASDLPMLAFAEVGKEATIPGPVLRVRAGTRVRVSVHNSIPDVELVVHGLGDHGAQEGAALTVASGTTELAEFTADAQGTFFYWGTVSGASGLARRLGFDSQLNGAFIVDPPTPAPVPEDRIFLISLWNDSTRADGRLRFDREFWAINGTGWPETERLEATVGDSIRWRVINASADVHPMHLHGFYFRVDALGGAGRDVIYEPTQRRMAVTERLTPGMTMQLVWSPDRAGGWIFHCHMTVHLLPQPQLAGQHARSEAHDPDRHLEDSMSGLILAIEVHPGAQPMEAGAERARRFLRLFIHSDSTAADSAGRRFTAVLQRGAAEPASDSVPAMGSPLVLERGEPTSIMVVNRTREPTSIHWHGLELESFFDGVVGLGGMPGMRTPPVLPADSFEVRITPPRSGTFMYHTHMDDVRQQVGGLYGSFVVYEPGARTDPARDIPLMIANDASGQVVVDGSRAPDTLRVGVGVPVRLRIANITVQNPGLVMRLVRGAEPVTWRHVATDGFERPAASVVPAPAVIPVSNGEIRDVEFTADRAGDLTFEVRASDGRLLVSRVVRAAAP